MKLVKVDISLLEKYSGDKEILEKDSRPCVLVIRLKYKERIHDFAVPLRSNIPAASPKSEFYPLPPRRTTKSKNRHGLHYIKMFPVSKKYINQYRIEGDPYAKLISNILNRNERQIVKECQQYLKAYEKGERSPYSTNIDYLIEQINQIVATDTKEEPKSKNDVVKDTKERTTKERVKEDAVNDTNSETENTTDNTIESNMEAEANVTTMNIATGSTSK